MRHCTTRLGLIPRYDSAKFRDTRQGNFAIGLNQILSRYETRKLHDTFPPDCKIRLNRIARHTVAKFHDTTQRNLKKTNSRYGLYAIRLRDMSRYDSNKLYVTTQRQFVIHRSEKTRYDSAKCHETTQKRLRQIALYN